MRELLLIHKQGSAVRSLEVLARMAHEAVLFGHTLIVEHLARLVRLVALHADRDNFTLLFPQLAVDHLAVHPLNFGVALEARINHVQFCDGGSGVGMRQDIVRGMAGDAGGAAAQPLLEKPFAVNTLGIVFQDVVFGDIPLLHDLRAFAVAGAAHQGNLQRRHGGIPVVQRQDAV